MKGLILEKIIVDSYIRRRPLICTIELTTQCNFRCVHCYVSCKEHPVYLSKKDAISFIDNVVAEGCLYLVLTGGDPLLHPDFSYIYTYARAKCNVVVFTNGYALNDEILNLFITFPPSKIEITLYGASNSTYMKTVKVPAYFVVLDVIHKLKMYNIPLELKTFLVNENFKDWPKIKEIAHNLGYNLKFDSFIVASRESKEYSHQLSSEFQIELLKKNGIKSSKICNELQTLISKRIPNKMYRCGAGMYSVWLRTDNTLNMCAFASACKGISLKSTTFSKAWERLGIEANSDIPEGLRCKSCVHIINCPICPTKYARINDYNNGSPLPVCLLVDERRT